MFNRNISSPFLLNIRHNLPPIGTLPRKLREVHLNDLKRFSSKKCNLFLWELPLVFLPANLDKEGVGRQFAPGLGSLPRHPGWVSCLWKIRRIFEIFT